MALSGIFCLEGDWSSDLRDETSVEPILELLARLKRAKYIHRNASTQDQFAHYVTAWAKPRYKNYPVLYLAFHGNESEFDLGAATVTLDDLAKMLAGQCRGRVLHFATCLTLGANNADLKRLVRKTGARAITGYQTEVGWLDSAVFEALMLDQLLDGARTDAFFRRLHAEHGEMTRRLGLVAATASAVYRPEAE